MVKLVCRRADVYASPVFFGNGVLDQQISYTLTQPYVQGDYCLLPDLQLQAGVRFSYLNWSNKVKAEPFGQLSWQPTALQTLQLSYGRQSQVFTD